MSLFPDEDILTKEIESWKGFAERLSDKEKETFLKMLDDCYKYSKAINAKGRPFPTEPVIMALLFSQHKLKEWLETQYNHKGAQLIVLQSFSVERFISDFGVVLVW